MIKKFCLLLILSVTAPAIYAQYYNEHYNINDIQNLSRAEYAVFGQNNQNLSPQARLMLTEQRLFGTTQPGNFSNRINFINRVIDNNNNNTFANLNNLKKRNRINYVLNEIFNGTMTGYSPNINYQINTNRYNMHPFTYHNTTIPQPYSNGIGNFVTQTRILFDN